MPHPTGPGERVQRLRTHLNGSLFAEAPRTESGVGRVESWVLVVSLLTIAVVLQLVRIGWSESLNSLWAEDGPIYLQGALTHSFWHAIVSTYATYLGIVPRLIAEIASRVPLHDAPAVISILSALLVGLSGLAVWKGGSAHIRDPYLRATLVALTVLCPVAGLESLDSAAYAVWFMLFASFWLLLWRPKTFWGALLASIFLLATGLTSPGVWFFAPLAALRAIAIRDRRDLAIVAGFAVGAVVQISVLSLSNEAAVEPLWNHDIWTVYLQRIVAGAPLGLRLGGVAWSHLGWPLLVALLLCGIGGLAVGIRRSATAARYIAAIAIPTSIVMFVVSLYQRALGAQMVWAEGLHNGTGSRYSIVPALLIVSAALALLDSSMRRQPDCNRLRWLSRATIGLLAIAIACSFYVRESSVRGKPLWDASLKSAALRCSTEHLAETAIQTSPPGFGIQLPCSQITGRDSSVP